MALVDASQDSLVRLADQLQAHGFVDLGHLPGQAGAQVAGRPFHHAEQAGDIVRNLGTAAVVFAIHRGEVIFQVDPGPHRPRRQQDAFQDLAFRVLGRVVGNQKQPAVEKRATGGAAPPDHRRRVGGMAQFRAGLAEIGGTAYHMLHGLPQAGTARGGGETAAAFVGGQQHRPPQVGAQPVQGRLEAGGEFFQVKPEDFLVAGVVFRA